MAIYFRFHTFTPGTLQVLYFLSLLFYQNVGMGCGEDIVNFMYQNCPCGGLCRLSVLLSDGVSMTDYCTCKSTTNLMEVIQNHWNHFPITISSRAAKKTRTYIACTALVAEKQMSVVHTCLDD